MSDDRRRLAEALHRAVCSDDGDTCCWDGEDREHDGLCTDQHGVFHQTGLETGLLALGVRPPASTDAGGRDD